MFLGLELVRTDYVWNTGFILWALLLCLVARLVSKSDVKLLLETFNSLYGEYVGTILCKFCRKLLTSVKLLYTLY